jgi:hypothetical protein
MSKPSATGSVPGPFLKKTKASKVQMSGKGAVESTMPGVMGAMKNDMYHRSVGGLLHETADGPIGPGTTHSAMEVLKIYGNTERHILGSASATPMPGAHYGQVPYPGAFSSHLGSSVS